MTGPLEACAPGAGLAGALANGAQGCIPDPGAREWFLVDRIDASRIALGQQVNVKLGNAPQRDPLGRFAHVRGIYFSAKGAFTVGGATNDVVLAQTMRGLYQSMHLEDVTGHPYFDALDGRDLADDAFFRHWSEQQWPLFYAPGGGDGFPLEIYSPPASNAQADIATDAGAATYIRDVSLYVPLVSNADGASPLEGLIPLAAIQVQGDSALRFTVAQSIPGAPAGVTWAGFRNPSPDLQANAGMEVWLDIVWLDSVVVDAPWQVESYVLNEQSGVLRHPDRITEYCAIRFHEEDAPTGADTSGYQAVENLDIFTLTCAGFTRISGYTLDQMVRRMMMFARTIPDSFLSEGNPTRGLPLVVKNPAANNFTYSVHALLLIAQRQRATATSGRIQYNYGTDPLSFVRYLHRTVLCQTASRVEAITKATNCNPCAMSAPNGKAPSTTYEPVVVVQGK